MTSAQRRGALLQAAVVAVFVALVATVFGAGTASAATGACAQTRAGASTVVVQDRVGVTGRISAGQRLGNDPRRVVLVVATGVAAETADAGAGDAAESCLNSFTAKAPVTMADGTKEAISKVKVGDTVMATDPQTGQTKAEPVVQLIRHTGKHAMVLIGLAGGSVLDSTSGHPIWDATQNAFVPANQVRVGDQLDTTGGKLLQVSTLRDYTADLTAYNLQIGQIHTYYAGVTPVLVHNSCVPDSISGYTRHGLNQAIGRDGGIGVAPKAMLDAVRAGDPVYDEARDTFAFSGDEATVVLSRTGRVVTTWARSSSGVRGFWGVP